MKPLDMKGLMLRSLLMRSTVKKGFNCRIPLVPETEIDGRTRTIIELGYYCMHGSWPVHPEGLSSICGTEGCVMHLGYLDEDDEDLQTVADQPRRMTLADMFRAGRSRGWFKGGNGYAN